MKIFINTIALFILTLTMSCGGGASSDTSASIPNGSSSSNEALETNQSTIYSEDYTMGGIKHVEHKNPRDGSMISEGSMKDGKKEGAWVFYYTGRDTGKVKSMKNYHKDQLNGLSLEFSNSGTITKRVDYDNGNIHGLYAEYKYNRAQKYIEYTHGEMNGAYNTYYSNGKKQQETKYTNGMKNGRSVFYNEEEQIIMDFVYKDNEKVSGGKVTPPPVSQEK